MENASHKQIMDFNIYVSSPIEPTRLAKNRNFVTPRGPGLVPLGFLHVEVRLPARPMRITPRTDCLRWLQSWLPGAAALYLRWAT